MFYVCHKKCPIFYGLITSIPALEKKCLLFQVKLTFSNTLIIHCLTIPNKQLVFTNNVPNSQLTIIKLNVDAIISRNLFSA